MASEWPRTDEVGEVLLRRRARLDDGGRERLGQDLLRLVHRFAQLRDLGGRLAAAVGDEERLGGDEPLREVRADRVAQPLEAARREAVRERLVARHVHGDELRVETLDLLLQRRPRTFLAVGDDARVEAGFLESVGVVARDDGDALEVISFVDEEARRAPDGVIGRDVEGQRVHRRLARQHQPRIDVRVAERRDEIAVHALLARTDLQGCKRRPRRRRRLRADGGPGRVERDLLLEDGGEQESGDHARQL